MVLEFTTVDVLRQQSGILPFGKYGMPLLIALTIAAASLLAFVFSLPAVLGYNAYIGPDMVAQWLLIAYGFSAMYIFIEPSKHPEGLHTLATSSIFVIIYLVLPLTAYRPGTGHHVNATLNLAMTCAAGAIGCKAKELLDHGSNTTAHVCNIICLCGVVMLMAVILRFEYVQRKRPAAPAASHPRSQDTTAKPDTPVYDITSFDKER